MAQAARIVEIGTTTLHRLERGPRTRSGFGSCSTCARYTNVRRPRRRR
ncbi:hypothetical protein [Nocardia nova]